MLFSFTQSSLAEHWVFSKLNTQELYIKDDLSRHLHAAVANECRFVELSLQSITPTCAALAMPRLNSSQKDKACSNGLHSPPVLKATGHKLHLDISLNGLHVPLYQIVFQHCHHTFASDPCSMTSAHPQQLFMVTRHETSTQHQVLNWHTSLPPKQLRSSECKSHSWTCHFHLGAHHVWVYSFPIKYPVSCQLDLISPDSRA